MATPAPSDPGSPSMSGPEVLVPDGLRVAFNAAKDAKLLTVHGIDGVGCGWLTIRFLGDWLRKCTFDPETGKSDIGIVICAFKHSIDYYIGHLQPFGIDLAWHVEKGHVTFLGNQYQTLITNYGTTPPTPPSVTFDASLELLMERSYEMRPKYDRTVLLLDNPEMGMMLTTDDDDVRVEKWLIAVDSATYVCFDGLLLLFFPLSSLKVNSCLPAYDASAPWSTNIRRIMTMQLSAWSLTLRTPYTSLSQTARRTHPRRPSAPSTSTHKWPSPSGQIMAWSVAAETAGSPLSTAWITMSMWATRWTRAMTRTIMSRCPTAAALR